MLIIHAFMATLALLSKAALVTFGTALGILVFGFILSALILVFVSSMLEST